MMELPDSRTHPFCSYFLAGYLAKVRDPTNFPSDQFPALFDRYEKLFDSALQVLNLKMEVLKSEPDFNFDHGNVKNLESGIAVLRVVNSLRQLNFLNIALLKRVRNARSADLICEKNEQRVCVEVKTITKQSSGRSGFFIEDQVYEKILESICKARNQLAATAVTMGCTVTVIAYVVNWFQQSIVLTLDDYQHIVNRLEKDQDQEFLKGVDGVLFLTKMGEKFFFLNEHGKCID